MESRAAGRWCENHQAAVGHCLVLELPGHDWTDAQIKKVAERLPISGRGFLLDSTTDPSGPTQFALLEWKTHVPHDKMPMTLTTPGGQLVQVTIPKGAAEVEAEVMGPLSEPAIDQEKNCIGPEVLEALRNLLTKCRSPDYSIASWGYRKLRLFSGKVPTPPGEEDFEAWMDQATQVLEEWDVPEISKKQRIIESLKGPAADTVRNLKMRQSDCTAQDYLDALHSVFGKIDKPADLLYQFEHTYQRVGEKLSSYVRRLDRLLHQLVLSKGIDPKQVDRARIRQIQEGSQALDPVVFKLHLGDQVEVPSYPQLIKKIREEEALQDLKSGYTSARPVKISQVRTVEAEPVSQNNFPEDASLTSLWKVLTQVV
ncbi:paraneoplastic antigen Ma1 homolog [Hyperolius riggenbachi]|uniref:paraneoplastic antigen Ma1 homolog n=1 Tax=Hyperolius riggenbachi TaxID=752182 RepID=UPI0035A30F1F